MEKSASWLLSRRVSSFQKFFELGQEESASPFLDSRAKQISRNLALKSSLLSALLLVLAYVLTWTCVRPWFHLPLSLVYFLSGTPSLIASVEDVLHRRNVNIDVLTTLSAFGALAVGAPMEGAFLLVLFALAGSLEDLVTLKAKTALSALNELVPQVACVIGEGGMLSDRAIDDVCVGDVVAVRMGEIVPLDGIVVRGQASISKAHLTGESRPILVHSQEEIVSGAKVLDGSLEVRVQCSSRDSTVAKLIRLITKAHSAKPKLSQTFDRFSRAYALTIISVTMLVLVLSWSPLGSGGEAFVRSVCFLITASPCALVLAVPITYLSALGAAARRGVVLRGGMILDRVNVCGAVAFDKTGTLTEGELALQEVLPLASPPLLAPDLALSVAASLERHAVHPIAAALIKAHDARGGGRYCETHDVRVVPGEGVFATVDWGQGPLQAFIGGPHSPCVGPLPACVLDRISEGGMAAVLLIGGQQASLFLLGDRVRPEAAPTIKALVSQGKHVIMLTGDRKPNAWKVGTALGIDDVRAELMPEHKLDVVSSLSERFGLLMVGDGINDAPALARATVGTSMGQLSSASAREASDIILLHNDVHAIPWIFCTAARTRVVMIQNLVIASLAIFAGTASSLVGIMPLWAAVLVHEGSTVLVGLNAMRLLAQPGRSSRLGASNSADRIDEC